MEDKSPTTPSNSTLVVKLGGAEGVDYLSICNDVSTLSAGNRRLVLVHGGSAEANRLGEAQGYPPRFITSPSGYTSRHTDPQTLEIFCMAVNGKINTGLVGQLQGLGVNALGLSGLDGGLLLADRKAAIISVENGRRRVIRDDFSGKINRVNSALLEILLENGYVPVIAPLAISPKGEALNVDADRVAAKVAAALKADTLLLLTAAPGLMRDFPDESTLIHKLPASGLQAALGYAKGRMKKKILGADEALQDGVKQVIIADGRIEAAISQALAGNGTIIG